MFRGQLRYGFCKNTSVCVTPGVLVTSSCISDSCSILLNGVPITIWKSPRTLKAIITFGILRSLSKTFETRDSADLCSDNVYFLRVFENSRQVTEKRTSRWGWRCATPIGLQNEPWIFGKYGHYRQGKRASIYAFRDPHQRPSGGGENLNQPSDN